ncbi:type I methionyl aminopeptidase [Paenibacillus sp. NPDC058071]|uniref:type I methionyl aminopeptidase n=1 Tax=Paenibacillus sp. NPDC058071 TaxID=3346326 RepID=UPI0036DA5AD3
MTLILKSKNEMKSIRRAGQILSACHKAIARRISPGVTTFEIDRFAERFLLDNGAVLAQKGEKGYPYTISASVNEVVYYGFPDRAPLSQGDVVTIEVAAEVNGARAISAWTYAIGVPAKEAAHLLKTAKLALNRGVMEAKPGNRLSDIVRAIQQSAEETGYRVAADFVRHGASAWLHDIGLEGEKGATGLESKLREGMIVTIGPILTAGVPSVLIAPDGRAARTIDGSLTAQFEHTVAVTGEGPVILTK